MSSLSGEVSKMHGKEEDGFVALKLDCGEDIFQCLHKAIQDFHIKSGYILMGIGMLRDLEIGYFDGDKYLAKQIDEAHELISLQGSISTKNEIVIHLHCSLAGPDHKLIGGHLSKGTVNVINEIFIKKVHEIELGRNLNPETGLKELYIS
ncbi:MAG: DUF296 domain-containing protein [Thermoplasmata archaeon]|nr:DUF296 domain-containing protein [Thermoplasmata archaeon]